jgi:hypothetical protein
MCLTAEDLSWLLFTRVMIAPRVTPTMRNESIARMAMWPIEMGFSLSTLSGVLGVVLSDKSKVKNFQISKIKLLKCRLCTI